MTAERTRAGGQAATQAGSDDGRWQDLPLGSARRHLIEDVAARYLALSGRPHSANRIDVGDVLHGGLAAGALTTARHLVDAWGEDGFRMGMLFIAPPRQTCEWSDRYVVSASRWLCRFGDLVDATPACERVAGSGDVKFTGGAARLRRDIHLTLAAVGDDYEACRYNRAVAGIMSMVNEMEKCTLDSVAARVIRRETLGLALIALMPVAPAMTSALWSRSRGKTGVVPRWPAVSPGALATDEVTLAVEVDGRVRGQLRTRRGLQGADVRRLAVRLGNVQRHLAGRVPHKVIYVPDRLINLVVS